METSVFPRMHVSLYVADLAATVSFYNTIFGQPAAKIRPGYAKYVLDQPSLIISFVENPQRVASNFGHLGFQVETVQELDERLARARAAGLVQREEVGTSCCYAKQDKFWVNDPDGVEWEVYYFHEDAEFNDPRYQAEYDQAASSQCCIAPAAQAPEEAVLVTEPMAFPLTLAGPAAQTSCESTASAASPAASACC
ncbi:ArsI/CadI family heavy metal resistance metalloenzyme [Hymenobacter persicinus]|uniref:Glyoxalase/bleomycin resistance/dioxygenase family protein n=1 Tax=Hymenobacter persicinus TaxID=2025506 RepID=A0A4Q5LDI9_9BACT|nr:ArsI/CadI family heavy metal resistance metalloenzyme [Hymenobacter persicinus]RYU78340.1 glyoxalase/bleomycin resistance/dioxygenase family protein [Hymenobacter persicinus]